MPGSIITGRDRMDRAAILSRYDAEVRASPPEEAGLERTWVGGVLRAQGIYNHIGWWSLNDGQVEAAVQREAEYFRGLGQDVEWKVFSHDGPPGLTAHLTAAGFVPDETETFLAFDLEAGGLDGASVPNVEVRRATGDAGLADYVTANSAAFGRSDHPFQQVEVLAPRLNDGSLEIYVAYADGKPICSGRLELMPGRAFAGLYGGGTDPAWRGRGVYRAVVAARAAEARARGVRYLTVDALETSRPILEQLGFEPLAQVTGWVLRAGS